HRDPVGIRLGGRRRGYAAQSSDEDGGASVTEELPAIQRGLGGESGHRGSPSCGAIERRKRPSAASGRTLPWSPRQVKLSRRIRDDLEVNLAAAARFGIRTIRFEDPARR